LPDPLPTADSLKAEAEGDKPSQAPAPVPFPLEGEVPRDELAVLLGEEESSLDFTVRILGRKVPKLGSKSGSEASLDLVLGGELYLGSGRKSDRLRLTLLEGPWLMPKGTEIWGRADRLGHLLVWPDRRSYRTVPVGSLLNLLGERRADVMPRFSPVFEGLRSQDGAWTSSRVTLKTPMGQLRLETRPQPASGEIPGELLCRALLEFIRARGAEACVGAGFVKEAELVFEGGPPVRFLVSVPTKRVDTGAKRFPSLFVTPSLRAGEYPEAVSGLLSRDEERETLNELGLEGPAANDEANIVITNGLGLPVLLSLFDRPLRYLAPQETLRLKSPRSVSYQVESLLGMIRGSQGRIEPGQELLLGGSPELQALGKPRVEE